MQTTPKIAVRANRTQKRNSHQLAYGSRLMINEHGIHARKLLTPVRHNRVNSDPFAHSSRLLSRYSSKPSLQKNKRTKERASRSQD